MRRAIILLVVSLLFPIVQVTASVRCSDEVFLRRAYLTITGALPTPKQATEFIDSTNADKREALIDELIAIDERLHADFAAGEISQEFHRMVKRFEFHLNAYCKARKFRHFKNKELLRAWEKFISLARVTKPTSPKKVYGIIQNDSPKDCGLDVLIQNVLELLY